MILKRNTLLLVCFIALSIPLAHAKDNKDANAKDKKAVYQFTDVKRVEVTPVRNQNKSGTCWSFSCIGMMEAEMLREGKQPVHLSEMYIVRKAYEEKAKKYVRMHGKINFAGGGSATDVRDMIAKYGIMPDSLYTGLQYGEAKHDHAELDEVLADYMEGVIKSKKVTTAWFKGFSAILDAYLGVVPDKFNWNGVSYTPLSFAKEVVGLDMDDYVSITSYTHAPLHTYFAVEVPDNWAWSLSFNVTLDEMMQTIDHAINNNYTVTWAADVSEKGFSWRNGVAIIPDTKVEDMTGSERDKWEKLTPEEKKNNFYEFKEIVPEKKITPEDREIAYDNYETTDDHGMVICGIAKDQKGNKYYIIKNSWDVNNPYKGFFYASESFVKYKTMSILLNKNAVPSSILNIMSK